MFDFTVLSTFHGSIDHLQTNIMASSPITSWQIDGKTMETLFGGRDFILGAPKSLQMVTVAMKLKGTCSLEEKLRQTSKVY